MCALVSCRPDECSGEAVRTSGLQMKRCRGASAAHHAVDLSSTNSFKAVYQQCLREVQGIDLVIKSVEAMVQPVETLEFQVFEKSMAPQWQAVKVLFMSSNEKIKDATRELIDVSFRYMISRLVLYCCSIPCADCQTSLIYEL